MSEAQIDPDLKTYLDEHCEVSAYKGGETIVEKGVRNIPFYVIKSGTCRVFIKDRNGGEIILDTLNVGRCFGEMSKLMGEVTNAFVSAESDVEVYSIPAEHFGEILGKIPTMAQRLYEDLCIRLQNMNSQLQTKVNDLLDLNSSLEDKIKEQVKDLESKNEDLEKKNNEMIMLSKQRDEFMNMAIHDMRSPLSNTLGFLEILRDDEGIKEREDIQKILGIIKNQSQGILELINDILDISKIQAGKIELEKISIDVNNVLEEAQQGNYILAKGKGIEIEITNDSDLPHAIADPRRIREVLDNLISNAIKYSPRECHIHLSAVKDNEDYIRISVRDEGQGIPSEEIPKLFSMFQQLSPKATEGEKGTGLGLAIVEKLVKLHEGKVWAESEVNKGSTFMFTLPIHQG